MSERFHEGDLIRVRSKEDVGIIKNGVILAEGRALQTRKTTGWAAFQVWEIGTNNEGWARTFNLNAVNVEVLAAAVH